jgi:hypothetical protein
MSRFAITIRCIAVLSCAALAPGCVPGLSRERLLPVRDARELVGCWHEGDWHFGLDSVPAVAYWKQPPPDAMQAWLYGHARGDLYWTLSPGGEAVLVADNGLDGSTTRYRMRDGNTLVGADTEWIDIAIPPRRTRSVARREPCPGPPADAPPPNPNQLESTLIPSLADVMVDSMVPRYASLAMLQARPEASDITRVVAAVVDARSHSHSDYIYGWRLDVQSDSVSRNEAVATVLLSLCEDRADAPNLRTERVRYRFVRAPGRWRLVSAEPLGRTLGVCGRQVPPTPQP